MKNLSALRNLVEKGEAVPSPEEDAPPQRSASRYLGDVLDMLHSAGYLSKEEVDDAAATIANNAENGYEEVVASLIKKGHVPGSKLMDGGHRRLREKMRATMRECMQSGLLEGNLLNESIRKGMTERQRGMAEKLEAAFRESITDVLKTEGYAPLDIDGVVAEVKKRIRMVATRVAMESGKRSIRPLRS